MPTIDKPFGNESEVVTLDTLSIENRLDRISLIGGLDITRDKKGLELALQLKQNLDNIVAFLQKQKLPSQIEGSSEITEVPNPFK